MTVFYCSALLYEGLAGGTKASPLLMQCRFDERVVLPDFKGSHVNVVNRFCNFSALQRHLPVSQGKLFVAIDENIKAIDSAAELSTRRINFKDRCVWFMV
jgi:hypothetical protein